MNVARALALVLAATVAMAGCGGGSSPTGTTSEAELALQRNELVAVAAGLESVAVEVKREVAAARAVWPRLAGGLPHSPTAPLRTGVARAAKLALQLPEPAFMANASRLTGPAAGLAGLYETFARLSERGWRLTESSISTILTGSPSAARFARDNSSLYVQSIYDSHYDLSLIGKSLAKGYARLGGPGAFGGRLTASRVSALEAGYSIGATRLSPHPREAEGHG